MKVAVFGRRIDPSYKEGIELFFRSIQKYDLDIFIHQHFAQHLNNLGISFTFSYSTFNVADDISSDFNLFFSLGGDGTLLESIRYVKDKKIPIAGINTGRLGFLANIAQEEIENSIDLLISGSYGIDNRTLLSFYCENNPFFSFPFALNEITVQKHDTSLITIETTIDGEEVNRYWADGLILSTPTGSTAYSLSTGGPIVSPEVKAIIVSPIASHNLSVRPLIIPNHRTIQLRASSRSGKYLVTLDSQSKVFDCDIPIEIKLAPFEVALACLPNHSFFQTIRKKLMWGADIRN
ncbi:MAG: NAD kinase [Bacteroidales bacterium]|nr:NAD kinase [Bacteroidales bacterium]